MVTPLNRNAMKPHTSLNLNELYDIATRHTRDAVVAIENNDLPRAYANLEERKELVRKIQRDMDLAPAWGSDSALDFAALKYLDADRALENVLDRLNY